jgi:hypothetical protein
VYDKICKTLQDTMNLFTRRQDKALDEKYSHWLHRAGAFLLLDSDINESYLLSLICSYSALRMFSVYTIEVGVSVWSWVMSCNPVLTPEILARLIGMWEITAIKRLGVYQADQSVGPFFGKLTYAPSKELDQVQDPSASHMVWIEFLHERLHCLRHGEKNVIDLLVQFICVFHTYMDKFR